MGINKMGSLENKLLFFSSAVLFLSVTCSSSLLLDRILNDVDPCEDACLKTYPSHTYEKDSSDCCLRGCRLYSIIELVGEEGDSNGTLKSCVDNCNDAYPSDEDGSSACALGCKSQRPVADKYGPMPSLDGYFPEQHSLVGMISPLLYMHNMYSNMIDKVSQHMSVSWSFYMQDGTGRLVVVKSQPQALDMDGQDFDDYSTFRQTANGVMESNIEPLDNTATDVFRNSQMKSLRSLEDGINFAGQNAHEPDNISNDWLTCIAKKTGIPRLLLCLIILLSAVTMIWLCMSAAVTAPDFRISQQKLSINGDLEYLRHVMQTKGLKACHPQDFVEARPLPTKIRVQQL